MKIRETFFIFLAVLVSLGANDVGPAGSELEAMYGVAAQEVNAGRYRAALKELDAIDARQPEMAAAKNLRGVALMRLREFGPAEKALRRARELDPELWEARFNLAEVPFLEKNWAEARHRFEALAEEKGEQSQGPTGDLIQFKILLTWLLQGKEKQAGEILARLQQSSASPAFYCGKAAFAFRQKDDTEARVALKAAEKSFSPDLYELFRESFYEVGWLEKVEDAPPVALEYISPAERMARARTDFEKAERAYRKGNYAEALQLLEAVDAMAPNQAVSHNLRGEVLLAQGKTDEAETAFRSALGADAQFADARYNLARVPFRKGDYTEARRQFEALLGATTAGTAKERERAQLIRYHIFLSLLREGQDAAAQKAMDEFKMMDDSPALYYAQAAWAFQHGNFAQGNNWVANAKNLYSGELNDSFAESLGDSGWSKQAAPAPAPTVPAVAEVTPAPSSVAELPAAEVAKNEAPPPVVPSPSAMPEPSATPDKVVAEVAKKKRARRARSEDAAEAKKSKRRTTHAKPVPTPPIPVPTPTVAASIAPAHQNFGDKVARLVLYPFKRGSENTASPTPNESAQPPPASPTPSPSSRGGRKN